MPAAPLPEPHDVDVPEGLTPQARQARQRFLDAYRDRLRDAAGTALNILLWGPSTRSSHPAGTKRLAARDRLIDMGHNAMLSEELAEEGRPWSLKWQEFVQARQADLVIVLVGMEDSLGALGETHDFANHPAIAGKIYVLFPRQLRRGYSGETVIRILEDGYGGVYWYDDREMAECSVLGRIVKRVEARQIVRAFTRGTYYD